MICPARDHVGVVLSATYVGAMAGLALMAMAIATGLSIASYALILFVVPRTSGRGLRAVRASSQPHPGGQRGLVVCRWARSGHRRLSLHPGDRQSEAVNGASGVLFIAAIGVATTRVEHCDVAAAALVMIDPSTTEKASPMTKDGVSATARGRRVCWLVRCGPIFKLLFAWPDHRPVAICAVVILEPYGHRCVSPLAI
jgi:hypothetical protein